MTGRPNGGTPWPSLSQMRSAAAKPRGREFLLEQRKQLRTNRTRLDEIHAAEAAAMDEALRNFDLVIDGLEA